MHPGSLKLIIAALIFLSLLISCKKKSTDIIFKKSNQTLGDTRSFGLAIADVDLDNDSDVFICNYIGASKLWLNDGKGKFEMSDQSFLDMEAHDAIVEDLNGDKYPDIFILYHASSC